MTTQPEEYTISYWSDEDVWVIYYKGEQLRKSYLYKSTLSDVEAWLNLKEKGFNI